VRLPDILERALQAIDPRATVCPGQKNSGRKVSDNERICVVSPMGIDLHAGCVGLNGYPVSSW
jgi:hypothetical protein